MHPKDRAHYYVAVACGGVWKTTNAGTTWTPIFDNEGSYSIGCVALDPKNPNVVWVGTGENNSQRSRRLRRRRLQAPIDGGKTWKNVGLEDSRTHRQDSHRPARFGHGLRRGAGPLWGPGGDRGLYKTTDGGKTWNKVLNISENTGVTDVVMDPRNPDVLDRRGLPAAPARLDAHQRRAGKSPSIAATDGGKTWTKIQAGLPDVDLGRIGLAIAPTDPDVVYAIVEAADGKGGIFRSHRPRRDLGEAQPVRPQAPCITATSSSIRRTRTASTS